MNRTKNTIGIIGLGTMGGAMAKNLIKGGYNVLGFDLDTEKNVELKHAGGEIATSPQDVFDTSEISISSLPSPEALFQTASQIEFQNFGAARPLVIETSTFSISDKQKAHRIFADIGIELLDCPLSGTGAQAALGDLAVFGSGDKPSFDLCLPVLKTISHTQHFLGEFGNGSRMKIVANLLIASHNVAAAEAFVLGASAGLEPQLIYDVISTSAATSRMFEIRGPLMVSDEYDTATMKMDLWQKDLGIIGAYAQELGVYAPLFEASVKLYEEGIAQGRDNQDTACVCAILEDISNLKFKKTRIKVSGDMSRSPEN